MAGDDLVNQEDIEKLLQQSSSGDAKTEDASASEADQPVAEDASAPKAEEPVAGGGDQDEDLGQDAIEAMFSGESEADKSSASPASPDDDKLLAQDDIEKLLSQAGKAGSESAPSSPPSSPVATRKPPANTPSDEGRVAQEDIDYLLNHAERALESIEAECEPELPAGTKRFVLEEFRGASASTEAATLDLIRDVDLDLRIELGRTHMYLEDVLKLRKGSVVPLDRLAGDPVDIYVNGRLIAKGEVLVLNDNFCVRVAELIAGAAAG